MYGDFRKFLTDELTAIRESGLYKHERVIQSPQGAAIRVRQGVVLNFCANNYLGLGDHPELVSAAKQALDAWGYGMSSVRFICGTQEVHKTLEQKLAQFVGTDDAILYSSCFDANGGVFETLMKEEDVIITDELNHASIIDGIRLSKAKRLIYKHLDLCDLAAKLGAAQTARFRLVVTDGVFSMDGDIAPLRAICELCEQHDALLMVDDSHATGFVGKTGRGTPEYCGVEGRVDILSSTLGKALGGASGGFIAARQEIVDLLRQRSRPYLFSNTLPPPITAAAIRCVEMISATTRLRDKLEENTLHFRRELTKAGFQIRPGVHPIVPIMLFEASVAQTMAARLLDEGIYVIGFFFPVVPKGQARIRVQISAAHETEHVERAIAAFTKIGKEMGIIK
ncbi:glycine C-acetyltransferase [candidate division KSB1 bacterium]|nr:glycine C-acetyltransferase [candidate division KSB1 bacterium]